VLRVERPPELAEDLKAGDVGVDGFVGVTGPLRFDEQGDSQTPLLFFRIEREKVERVEQEDLLKGAG
jgi:hypothetical protein